MLLFHIPTVIKALGIVARFTLPIYKNCKIVDTLIRGDSEIWARKR